MSRLIIIVKIQTINFDRHRSCPLTVLFVVSVIFTDYFYAIHIVLEKYHLRSDIVLLDINYDKTYRTNNEKTVSIIKTSHLLHHLFCFIALKRLYITHFIIGDYLSIARLKDIGQLVLVRYTVLNIHLSYLKKMIGTEP